MMKNISVNNTLTKLSNTNYCVEATEEVKKMHLNVNQANTRNHNNITKVYGKQSKEQKFEIAYLKLIQERNQIKEYKALGTEFNVRSLYYSNRIF
ncbi:MAG: hypothetical protein HeimC2_38470 [Candidatus Heimdallarchaeota archaeon LC_2]|nr:MAG: hypothetical protein HeimC2_38470 [Candidatus Heimdallarchaeota archaeon LC_2]